MAEEVRAPLAGNIWSILVEVGAKVEEDDELRVVVTDDRPAKEVEEAFARQA